VKAQKRYEQQRSSSTKELLSNSVYIVIVSSINKHYKKTNVTVRENLALNPA